MSAFPDEPGHFLDWVTKQENYKEIESHLIAHAYLPRKLYGAYLKSIWKDARQSIPSIHRLSEWQTSIVDLDQDERGFTLTDEKGTTFHADKVIVATGNESPGNLTGVDLTSIDPKVYFKNPWDVACVTDTDESLPILIIGNGLTMVDTVIGLREHGFRNVIFSISPNGFNILPHRHPGLEYDTILQEVDTANSLHELVRVTNKHIKKVRSLGISAEPVINALRSRTSHIWMRLSEKEKEVFYHRLRHLWGVARHRLPLHVHDQIQNERIQGSLKVYPGKITKVEQVIDGAIVNYFNKKSKTHHKLFVSRIINCTGPATDVKQSSNRLLVNLIKKNLIEQDHLKLGIQINPDNYTVLKNGLEVTGLHAIGSLLRGVLWESTAIGELRVQARSISETIIKDFEHSA